MSTYQVLEAYVSLRREIALLRAETKKASELGHNQISVLYKLSLGSATMGELAEHTLSDKASLTRTVASLEKAGFVTRQISEDDRRVTIIELTPAGKKPAQKAIELRSDIGRDLDATLTPEERRQFSLLAEKICTNLKNRNELRG